MDDIMEALQRKWDKAEQVEDLSIGDTVIIRNDGVSGFSIIVVSTEFVRAGLDRSTARRVSKAQPEVDLIYKKRTVESVKHAEELPLGFTVARQNQIGRWETATKVVSPIKPKGYLWAGADNDDVIGWIYFEPVEWQEAWEGYMR